MTLWRNELGERLWRKLRSSTVERPTQWGRGRGPFSVPNCGKRSSYRLISLNQFFSDDALARARARWRDR